MTPVGLNMNSFYITLERSDKEGITFYYRWLHEYRHLAETGFLPDDHHRSVQKSQKLIPFLARQPVFFLFQSQNVQPVEVVFGKNKRFRF